jgi:hypothetical protein
LRHKFFYGFIERSISDDPAQHVENHAAFVGGQGLELRRERIQLADATQRRGVIGKSAHGHIARSVFKGLLSGGALHVTHF